MGTAMDTVLAYLISIGIVGFGVWIVAADIAGSDIVPIWIVLGLLPIAVGLMSLFGEIHNRRATQSQ
jgi:hypothetical protein